MAAERTCPAGRQLQVGGGAHVQAGYFYIIKPVIPPELEEDITFFETG